jgi:hypothetical protein
MVDEKKPKKIIPLRVSLSDIFKSLGDLVPEFYEGTIWQCVDGSLLLKITHTIEVADVWRDEENPIIPLCLYNTQWEEDLSDKRKAELSQVFNEIRQRIFDKNLKGQKPNDKESD